MIENYKGMREFSIDEYKTLNYISKSWLKTTNSFGFKEYKTPILSLEELYVNKTSEEILTSQMYSFIDKGNKKIVIRPELTPFIANTVARLKYDKKFLDPLKLTTIGSVFRYEQPQKGRKREHIQFNADIFGIQDDFVIAELINIIMLVFLDLGFKKNDFIVKINDRSYIEHLLTSNKVVSKDKMQSLFSLLDKKNKLTHFEFDNRLKKIIEKNVNLETLLSTEPKSVKYIKNILPSKYNLIYDPFTVRGFDYYTGVVFEIFAKSEINTRSIAGGGRYDKLVEAYGSDNVPAVGIGMGDVCLMDYMEEKNIKPVCVEEKIVITSTASVDVNTKFELGNILRSNLPNMVINVLDTQPKKLNKFYKRMECDKVVYIINIENKYECSLKTLNTKKLETLKIDKVLMYIQNK